MAREVVVASAVRTPIGGYGGSLKDVSPSELGAHCVREAVSRAGIEPSDVGHVVIGNVIHTDTHDHYLSRVVALNGGLPFETPAVTVNRLCGSGLQAIVTAAQTIMLGDADVTVAGGAESMSRSPYVLASTRWGARMGNTTVIDMMVGALSDPFDDCHMGITAENLAKKYDISREDQDAFAVQSHQRAAAAIASGYFKDQIAPVAVKVKRDMVTFDTDETVRTDTSVEKLARLKPAFDKKGSVTAGNSANINDAAAAVVLVERSIAEDSGLIPLGRLVAYSYAGVDPKYMGIGPVYAIRRALEHAGMSLGEMDLVEINEAFSSQYLACERELELNREITNVNSGGVAIGHPLAASGTRITMHLLYELKRRGKKYGVGSACIGGGQGIAVVVEAF